MGVQLYELLAGPAHHGQHDTMEHDTMEHDTMDNMPPPQWERN
jgi:hypothetical protein